MRRLLGGLFFSAIAFAAGHDDPHAHEHHLGVVGTDTLRTVWAESTCATTISITTRYDCGTSFTITT